MPIGKQKIEIAIYIYSYRAIAMLWNSNTAAMHVGDVPEQIIEKMSKKITGMKIRRKIKQHPI